MTKLSWDFDTSLNCDVAYHNGYRIRAEHDQSPSNPFEEWDCEWPILVQTGRNGYGYDVARYEKEAPHSLDEPFRYFNDAQLIHNQVHIAKALGTTVAQLLVDHAGEGDDHPVNYCRDADLLRTVFGEAQGNYGEGKQFDLLVELYTIAGIPAYTETSRGYCQGDWANVLVVAPPETQEKFGCDIERFRTEAKTLAPVSRIGIGQTLEDWIAQKAAELMLRSTVNLYGYWAWGDVYGYVIEQRDPEDPDEWIDACDHNSCWGYYGDDHAESGLEDAALECVPERPAPEPIVCPELEAA